MDLFTIERLCLSLSGQRTSQKLFDISGEVLSLTLSIWRNHDQRKVPDIDHGFIVRLPVSLLYLTQFPPP